MRDPITLPLPLVPLLLSAILFTAGCQKTMKQAPAAAERNQASPAGSPPAPASQPSYETYVARGSEELRLKTALQEQMFQISRAAWNVDQDTGIIQFQSPSGVVATAPVQIIGTYNTADGRWLWAWANPSVDPKLATHAEQLRAYGQQHGIAELTTRKLTCDEQHCWTFVAAEVAMTSAQGAYRGPAGDTMVFMTFGTVSMNKSR